MKTEARPVTTEKALEAADKLKAAVILLEMYPGLRSAQRSAQRLAIVALAILGEER